MIKIKVSYEQTKELYRLIKLLGEDVKSCKTSKKQEGKNKTAYIELKNS